MREGGRGGEGDERGMETAGEGGKRVREGWKGMGRGG